MAKGRYASQAKARADHAALAHIDRLTTMLAEEKMRRRAAEERARLLEVADVEARRRAAANDDALAAALDKLKWWERVAREDHDRRAAALRELPRRLAPDVRFIGTNVEWIEYVHQRYPALVAALLARPADPAPPRHRDRHSLYTRHERRLSDADLIRFQQVSGQRSRVGDDQQAVDWAAIYEARQLDFTTEELIEYATIQPGPHPR